VEHLLAGADPSLVDSVVVQLQAVAEPRDRSGIPGTGGDARPLAASEQPALESASGSGPDGAQTDPIRAGAPLDTLRVARSKLDDLLLQGEDFLVLKLAAAECTGLAEELIHSLEQNQRERPDGGLAEAIAASRRLLFHLQRDERITTRYVDRLHRQTRQLRLAPVSSVFNLFPLMVHDLATEQAKEVSLVMHGTDLEVDLQILEAMKDPLIHLVRNAVDHGIEAPEKRIEQGKPGQARLELRVTSIEGGRIQICVEDDGAGIDPAEVRAAAVRAHFLAPEVAESLSADAAIDLLFRSGFSTSSRITAISGQGIGLSIVRERVDGLGGQIRVESEPGRGTAVHILLPATVATFRGLLVRAGGQPFLFPLESIQRTLRVDQRDIHRAEGREIIRWQEQLMPVGRLDALLGMPESQGPDRSGTPGMHTALVIRVGEDQAAVLVDEVLGDREVLVKALQRPLVRVPCVASAGMLGTGSVVLVLRPYDILKILHSRPVPAVPSVAHRPTATPTILVADDSITTRMLIKNILEAAGYEVRVAVDGLDAWTSLKADSCDLLMSDVDMPRMTGFDLAARVREDPDLKDLPIVLVTSLDSRDDKERGMAVGANAYVVKTDMAQSNLLEIVRRFV